MGFVSLITFVIIYTTCHADVNKEDADIEYEPKFAEDEMSLSHGEIIFSAILFRHGDRNPVGTYPKNPHYEQFRQAGRARLTQAGKERAYRLGIWARKRYEHLIQEKPYSPRLLKVLSSDTDRTISSAQLFLAGFYPPTTKKEKWNKDIHWQPIPVFSIPSKVDRLLRPEMYCSRYNLEVERIKSDPIMIEFDKKWKEDYEIISKNAEIEIPENDAILAISKVSELYDHLYIQEKQKLEHPEWVGEYYPWPLRHASIMYFKMHTFNEEMKRIKGGPLLEHILNEFKNKRDNPQSPKLFQIYSGHDATLIGLMDTIGVYEETKTYYSASLLIELRILNKEYIITISYRNVEDDAPELLEHDDCPSPCSLDKFIEVTKSMIPEDLIKECEQLTPDYNEILY